MSLKVGDYIYWDEWKGGYIMNVFPRGLFLLFGTLGEPGIDCEIYKRFKSYVPEPVLPLPNYRILSEKERLALVNGDMVYSGTGWVHMPVGYAGSRYGLYIIRKKGK